MQVEIRGREIYITKTLRGHIERRLGFALRRFSRCIRKVLVRVRDLNGPKGGVDKDCHVAVIVSPSTTVIAEASDSNVYVAVDQVADKASRSVARQLKRTHGKHHLMRITQMLS